MNITKYKRIFSVISDEYGIDPLKDTMAEGIASIELFNFHTVTYAERGAPDAISFKYYQTHDLWWVILEFNGLFSYRQIVEGVVLMIPAVADITQVAAFQSNRKVFTKRVIEI